MPRTCKSLLAQSGLKSFFHLGAFARLASTLALVAMVFAACSKKPMTHQEDCQKKFTEFHGKFEKKNYQAAREGYATLITACSGFEFTEQALFETAEAYFQQGDFVESESEYRSFLKEYPSSARYGEQARYRMALSSANQVEIAARDQSKTLEAIADFETFLQEHEESKWADSAKIQLDKLRNLLAEKQLQIAKLYTRMGEPQAAAVYYKTVLKEYGDRINERDVTLKLAYCYIELEQFDEAETYLRKFDGIAKEDTFKIKVKEAYQVLEKARERHAREKREEKEQANRQEPL